MTCGAHIVDHAYLIMPHLQRFLHLSNLGLHGLDLDIGSKRLARLAARKMSTRWQIIFLHTWQQEVEASATLAPASTSSLSEETCKLGNEMRVLFR